ncbi:hypothetical protein [Amycolatopsis kentuckyensis]|uniref:hypothetical protein n=1 Tax=Amycolatopsis kentuckyensis TaxID=218823 RepID=UPI00356A386A
MTVWTGQIIAVSAYAAVLVWGVIMGVRRRALRRLLPILALGVLALAGGVTTIVLTA